MVHNYFKLAFSSKKKKTSNAPHLPGNLFFFSFCLFYRYVLKPNTLVDGEENILLLVVKIKINVSSINLFHVVANDFMDYSSSLSVAFFYCILFFMYRSSRNRFDSSLLPSGRVILVNVTADRIR